MKNDLKQKKRPSKYNVVDDQKESKQWKNIQGKDENQRGGLTILNSTIHCKSSKISLSKGRTNLEESKEEPSQKVVTTIIVALIDKNKIPTDANEIQKCTKVSFGHANQNGNLTEQCMKQGIDLLMQMLTQIRKNQPSIGKHSAMLSKLLKNYQQQCKSFD